MKKITKVTLTNFQSHADTTISLHEGFNAFIGESDQGKTAIFRAIRWALENRPEGKEFIRKGATSATVVVSFSDGTTIKRHRGARENYYEIFQPGRDPIRLDSFGKAVPIEVILAHGMRAVSLGLGKKELLNFSQQLDGPFLLQDSPETRAVAVGRLSHTEVVDRAIRVTASDILAGRKESRRLTDILIAIEDRIASYGHLKELGAALNIIGAELSALESHLSALASLRATVARYLELCGRRAQLDEEISRCSDYPEICGRVQQLEEDFANFYKATTVNTNLLKENAVFDNAAITARHHSYANDALHAISEAEVAFSDYKAVRDRVVAIRPLEVASKQAQMVLIQYASAHEASSLADECHGRLAEHSRLKAVETNLTFNINRSKTGSAVVDGLREQLTSAVREYSSAIKAAGKCPICFSEVGDSAMRNIEDNLF